MKKILILLWLNFTFLFVSCGPSTTINLTITDYHYDPDTFTVPAGQEITVNIDNQGFVSHQFVIFKLGTDAGGKIGPEDQDNIYWRFEVLPGHTDSATFVAPSEPVLLDGVRWPAANTSATWPGPASCPMAA